MTAPRRLLIIDQNPSVSEGWAWEPSFTTAEVNLERAQWTSFAPDTLHKCSADLIVPVATTPEPAAIRFFRWLRKNPLATPTLAILPENGNDDLMRDAVEVADDSSLHRFAPENCVIASPGSLVAARVMQKLCTTDLLRSWVSSN